MNIANLNKENKTQKKEKRIPPKKKKEKILTTV